MKRVVLFDTSIATLNQGDEIINISIKNNWPELFKDNYIVKMPAHTPLYSLLQIILYKKKMEILKNAEYKFLCGTNAIYTNMLRPLPNWNISLFNTSIVKNTICLGVGIGINSKSIDWYTRKLYDKVLSHDFIHSTRDEKTADFLRRLGFNAINTGCPTLWGLTKELCNEIPKEKQKAVVFTLTYYSPDKENDKKMIDILSKEYEKLYFWPQCYNDFCYLKSFDLKTKINIIPPNVEHYDKYLSNLDCDYVGNRLHGGIYAVQHKKRAIIISIDYRAKEMNKNYSFECIDRENISIQLKDKINSVWETKINGIDLNKIMKWKNQFKNE